MAHIRPDNTQKGKISYNAGIVSGIVALAVSEVDGVTLLNTKSKGIKLLFEKQGKGRLRIQRAFACFPHSAVYKAQRRIHDKIQGR